MRVAALLSAFCAAAAVHAEPQTAQIYIQPVETSGAPSPLAEVSYDLAALATTSVISYDAPDIPESSKLVRIGLFDRKTKSWVSGTTVASAENFSKGYSPTITLSIDSHGRILSAALKGVQIDAGQTRDFGPKAVVLTERKGPQPQLNKPVVITEGKKAEEEQEKTFLQKYDTFVNLNMGGCVFANSSSQVLVDDCHCGVHSGQWRRRPGEIDEQYNFNREHCYALLAFSRSDLIFVVDVS